MIQTVVRVGLGYPAKLVNVERTMELVAVLAFKGLHNSNQGLEGCSERLEGSGISQPEGWIVM